MKQLCPSPIKQDNFTEVWSYTDQKRRIAKKKNVTSKVASFFSNLVFTVLTFVAGNGLIHDHLTGSYTSFLETVPWLLPTWEKYSALFLKPGQSATVQVILTALLVYGISFTVCGIFSLLVLALYHPLKKKLPAASVKENAEQLLDIARDARRYALRSSSRSSVLWSLLFTASVFATLAMYWLTTLSDMEAITEFFTGFVMEKLAPYLASNTQYMTIQGSLLAPCITLFCLGIYLGYAALSGIHTLTVQFMYKYRVPYSFVAQIECYSIFADENVSGLSSEEVEQLHRDQAADKRIQALELERMGAHPRAKRLLAEAAHGGDVQAMEHYARHWLIANVRDPARYWLERSVETGQASEDALKLLKRIKWRRSIQVRYLKEDT